MDATNYFFSSNSVWAIAYYPQDALIGPYRGASGDTYLNLNSEANFLSYAPGAAGYSLMLHEIGHTLGLKHPHEGGQTLRDLGIAAYDKDWFSVMSYNDDYNWNLKSWDPATPMLLDVLAIQYLYGPNTTTNATNSTHTLSLTNLYATIWDAGGTDKVDISGSTVGWTVQLPNLQLSSLVSTKAGYAIPTNELSLLSYKTLYWLTGDIENVSGSAFADQLYGSDLNNQLTGNAGDDYIDGGAGIDTALYSGNRSAYTVSKGADGAWHVNNTSRNGQVTTAIGSGNDYGTGVAVQADGKILVSGGSVNGTNEDFALVRYNTNGTLDTTFSSDGKVTSAIGSGNDSGYNVAVQADGKILVAGNSSNGTNIDFALVRYNTNGTLDTTFGTLSQNSSSDGTDTLTGIERLSFADGKLGLDTSGNSGQMYRLYKAAFDRVPDAPGLGHNIRLVDGGLTLAQMSSAFVVSAEFTNTYGALSNAQFINQLYLNVLDRTPDAPGLAHNLNLLNTTLTRADMLAAYSESAENQINLIGQIQDGIWFT